MPGGARTHHVTTLYGALGPPAAIPWSPRPAGAQGPPRESPWAGFVAPSPRVGWLRTALWGFLVRVLSRTTRPTRAPTPRPQCALPLRSWNCVR